MLRCPAYNTEAPVPRASVAGIGQNVGSYGGDRTNPLVTIDPAIEALANVVRRT